MPGVIFDVYDLGKVFLPSGPEAVVLPEDFLSRLQQGFSIFPTLQPFNMVPHVVLTPNYIITFVATS